MKNSEGSMLLHLVVAQQQPAVLEMIEPSSLSLHVLPLNLLQPIHLLSPITQVIRKSLPEVRV